MLLSENAKSVNIPKLEIEADDVKATKVQNE
jgi:Fe-S cluster assembly scaffold protein SufB